jgi:hypothetical protein
LLLEWIPEINTNPEQLLCARMMMFIKFDVVWFASAARCADRLSLGSKDNPVNKTGPEHFPYTGHIHPDTSIH